MLSRCFWRCCAESLAFNIEIYVCVPEHTQMAVKSERSFVLMYNILFTPQKKRMEYGKIERGILLKRIEKDSSYPE